MSINAALNLFLDEYPDAIKHDFAENPVADFIRNDVPVTLEEVIGTSDRYLIHGSAGQGNWARVPWVAIFDRLITETAQDGYYILYLAKEDFTGVYLTLNQGVTTIRNLYGADAKAALSTRASDYLARLGKLSTSYILGPIDLHASANSLGALYEKGSICAKFYSKGDIPADDLLEKDLKELMSFYLSLATKELLPSAVSTDEDDEEDFGEEDLRTLREHKRIERNRKLSAKAKKIHGYVCQACDFDFEKQYGEIGRGFIEAHHLTPLYELKFQKITLKAKEDFSVLCSNCHRMIHKSEFVSKVKEFREKYVIK